MSLTRLCPRLRESYEEGHTQLAGFNHFSGTDKELSMVAFEYEVTEFVLDVPPESL